MICDMPWNVLEKSTTLPSENNFVVKEIKKYLSYNMLKDKIERKL